MAEKRLESKAMGDDDDFAKTLSWIRLGTKIKIITIFKIKGQNIKFSTAAFINVSPFEKMLDLEKTSET